MVELGSYTPTSTHLVVGAAFSMHGMGEFVAFFFFWWVSVSYHHVIDFLLSLSLSLSLLILPPLPPSSGSLLEESEHFMYAHLGVLQLGDSELNVK
jgi:hypothetical protein